MKTETKSFFCVMLTEDEIFTLRSLVSRFYLDNPNRKDLDYFKELADKLRGYSHSEIEG